MNKQQLMKDYHYLRDNVDHAVSEDWLVNTVFNEMMSGEMTILEFMVGAIQDIFDYSLDGYIEEDLEFLKTDKKAKRIIKRYNIDFETDDN